MEVLGVVMEVEYGAIMEEEEDVAEENRGVSPTPFVVGGARAEVGCADRGVLISAPELLVPAVAPELEVVPVVMGLADEPDVADDVG